MYYQAIESEQAKRKERNAMFETNSYVAKRCCCRMCISRAYPYGGVHSYGFYMAEAFRSGLENIAPIQTESAQSLGMNPT